MQNNRAEPELISPTIRSEIQAHIGFLYHNLRPRNEDKYLLDMILALIQFGHKVTVFTSSLEEDNCLEACARVQDLQIRYSGWWLPDRIFGKFAYLIGKFKAMWMAVHLLFMSRAERPKLIILDTDAIPLLILHYFSNYKTIFIQHFNELLLLERCSQNVKISPGLFMIKSMGFADQVLVQTRGLAEVFRRSFPKIEKKINISYPCAENALFSEDLIDIESIVPDFHRGDFLFCCFGDYNKRSNFELALAALRKCYETIEAELKPRIHLVIVSSYDTENGLRKEYCDQLINLTKNKPYANQITFLSNMNNVHRMSILQACIALLQPIANNLYPEPILSAMSLGKAVIAVNSGFGQEVLVHRISGVLVDPEPQKMAKAMKKLVASPLLRTFIGNMARQAFLGNFSFKIFAETLNNTVIDIFMKPSKTKGN